MPNTNEDHRKGGNLNYPDASTAARMHSHISGDPDDRVRIVKSDFAIISASLYY
jgi:hypothetical protein